MVSWAIAFLILSVISGFFGVAAGISSMAELVFFAALLVAAAIFLIGRRRHPTPSPGVDAMKGRTIRGLAAATLLATVLSSAGCGYFLHPERRGNTGGGVDTGTLVMDLLWLLPGIVPGVVALIVDFSSGAIYRGGGQGVAVRMGPQGHVAVRLPDAPTRAQLELRLVTADHRVLAKRVAVVGPEVRGHTVELTIDEPMLPEPSETIYLEVVNAAGASARFPTPIEVAH